MNTGVWWCNREKKPRHGTVLKKKRFMMIIFFAIRETAEKAGYVGTKLRIALQLFLNVGELGTESGSRRVHKAIN
jgi:hypothetical protein